VACLITIFDCRLVKLITNCVKQKLGCMPHKIIGQKEKLDYLLCVTNSCSIVMF